MPAKVNLSRKEKKDAIRYVSLTGFYLVRLANFLQIDFRTLKRVLAEDEEFYNHLKQSEADFIGNVVQKTVDKRPDFILKSKYAEEFPDRVEVEHSGKISFTEFIANEGLDESEKPAGREESEND